MFFFAKITKHNNKRNKKIIKIFFIVNNLFYIPSSYGKSTSV